MIGTRDWRNWALLASLGIIWGGSFTAVGVAVQDLPPLTVAFMRIAIGAAILTPLAYAYGHGLPRDRRVWAFALIAAAAANAVPFVLLAWAQSSVSSGLAAVFMAALPLIVLPLAHFLVPGEGLTWAKAIGFLIGFAGVVWLIDPRVVLELGAGDGWVLLAQLACLGAATGYAVGSVATKLAPPCHPFSFGALSLLLAAAMLGPVTFALEAPFALAWSSRSLVAVGALGVFPTALAMVLLLLVLRRTGPSFLSLVNYQVPIWGMVFGVLLLGEQVPERAVPALMLILLGVAISQGALRGVLGGARNA
ncbi:MAG: DMT family transporter, partial [Pseudomonadota bacterium]